MIKIVVGTNSLTDSQYPAYTNHCQFWFRLGRRHQDIDFCFVNPSRTSIDRMRNMAGKIAQQIGAKYLLFLDDDVLVPQDISPLQGLIDCDSDIAAGNVLIRGYPFNYMAFKENLITRTSEGVSLNIISEEGHGIEAVDAVGFSFCLIKTSLLDKVPKPWFITGPNFTEDVYFCVKAKQHYPEVSIKINWNVVCSHIMWPEVINTQNRQPYRRYYEAMNPWAEDGKAKIIVQQSVTIPMEAVILRDNDMMEVK